MTRPIVVALSDTACLQNALPVAQFLSKHGHTVRLYIKPGSAAENELPKLGMSMLLSDSVPEDAVLLTCLPTWSKDKIAPSVEVILISENSEPSDERLRIWSEHKSLHVLAALPLPGKHALVTGLPVLDKVVQHIHSVEAASLQKLHANGAKRLLSLVLPGDTESCYRMLEMVEMSTLLQHRGWAIFARSHPNLKKDSRGYKEVAMQVQKLGGIHLDEANSEYTLEDQIAAGADGYIVCDWNSSVIGQAVCTGMAVLIVPPTMCNPIQWALESPFISGGYAAPLLGKISPRTPHLNRMQSGHGSAVQNIALVVLDAVE